MKISLMIPSPQKVHAAGHDQILSFLLQGTDITHVSDIDVDAAMAGCSSRKVSELSRTRGGSGRRLGIFIEVWVCHLKSVGGVSTATHEMN
jgi:hypothetical protein